MKEKVGRSVNYSLTDLGREARDDVGVFEDALENAKVARKQRTLELAEEVEEL